MHLCSPSLHLPLTAHNHWFAPCFHFLAIYISGILYFLVFISFHRRKLSLDSSMLLHVSAVCFLFIVELYIIVYTIIFNLFSCWVSYVLIAIHEFLFVKCLLKYFAYWTSNWVKNRKRSQGWVCRQWGSRK